MHTSIRTLLCGAALVAALSTSAFADLRYTTESTMSVEGQTQPMMTTTTQVKGNKERVDMAMQMGPMKMQRTTITSCGTRQRIEVSDAARVYAAQAMNPLTSALGQADTRKKNRREHQQGTGKITTTLTIKDLGREKVGQFDTEHYVITMQIESSGCAGSANNEIKSEIWVAPKAHTFYCPEMCKPEHVAENDGCKVTYVMKGDLTRFAAIQQGLVVKRVCVLDGGSKMTMLVTAYEDNVTLDESTFNVPAGYNKVSPEEFESAVMNAMMQQMRRAPDSDQ